MDQQATQDLCHQIGTVISSLGNVWAWGIHVQLRGKVTIITSISIRCWGRDDKASKIYPYKYHITCTIVCRFILYRLLLQYGYSEYAANVHCNVICLFLSPEMRAQFSYFQMLLAIEKTGYCDDSCSGNAFYSNAPEAGCLKPGTGNCSLSKYSFL